LLKKKIAGDGIRTHDVQLGKELGAASRLAAKLVFPAVYHGSVLLQGFAFVNVNKRLTAVFGSKCGNYHIESEGSVAMMKKVA
jgi:hypothetical protein